MKLAILVKGESENNNAFDREAIEKLMAYFEELRASEVFGPPEGVRLNFIFDGFKIPAEEPPAIDVAPKASKKKKEAV